MLVERHAVRRFVTSILAVSLAFLYSLPQAATVDNLYEVTLPIQSSRDAAFADALNAVAVRVSGRRDAPARLGSAAKDARRYVQRFSFTSDNQLQVAFDAGSIDRLLDEAGLPIWGKERPLTLVLLSVPSATGSFLLEATYPSAERELIAKAGRERGVPIVWPTLDPQDRARLAGYASAAQALPIARGYGANAVLVGQAQRDAAGQLVVRWSVAVEGAAAETTGGVEAGVHLAADTFGRLFAATAGSLARVNIEVSGIEDLHDYAATLSYLEGMTLVRSVSLEQVSGDTMRFQLAVRGDAATLRRALALDDKLVPTADAGIASDRLQLRLRR
jgi:hypothetical protein